MASQPKNEKALINKIYIPDIVLRFNDLKRLRTLAPPSV